MVKRQGSHKRKSRHKLKKNVRTRGKVGLTRYFTKFEAGERVVLKAEPAVQKGIYHLRYHGKQAIVTRKQGFCYEVSIKDGGVTKRFIVHPVHLKKL